MLFERLCAAARGRLYARCRHFLRLYSYGSLQGWPKDGKEDSGPTHCAVSLSGRFVAAANYGTGEVALYSTGGAGRLQPGKIVASYGNRSKCHCVAFDYTGAAFMYVVDLGLDRIHAFKFEESSGALVPLPPLRFQDGTHPRHIAFHPAGGYAVVITEAANTLVLMTHNADTGALVPIFEVSALPSDFPANAASATAEVIFSPDGQYVFASNRGQKGAPSSITSFKLAIGGGGGGGGGVLRAATGNGSTMPVLGTAAAASLLLVGAATTASAAITSPRGVGLSGDGKVLIVGSQDTNLIAALAVGADGSLKLVGQPVVHRGVVAPTSIRFLAGGD